MPMVYSNDGMSFRNVPPGYVVQAGEAILPEGATDAQIAAAFPGYGGPVETPPQAPTLVASAFAINVAGGDIPSIGGTFNIAAAIYLDVGVYMLLFSSEWPDSDYYTVITGGAPCMDTTESDTSFLRISALDAVGGSPIDPAQFSVQIYRI